LPTTRNENKKSLPKFKRTSLQNFTKLLFIKIIFQFKLLQPILFIRMNDPLAPDVFFFQTLLLPFFSQLANLRW